MSTENQVPKSQLPRVAITMGDAAGVGPEIIAAAWSSARLHGRCEPFVLGDPQVMRRAVELRCSRPVQVQEIKSVAEAHPAVDCLPVLTPPQSTKKFGNVADVRRGEIDASAGAAAYDAIRAAGELALAGDVDAIVTAPIHKKSLREAGVEFPGHTELFAEMCGVPEFAMMLFRPAPAEQTAADGRRGSPGLGVAHVTLHMALRDVFEHLTGEAIVEKSRLLDGMLRDLHLGNSGERQSGQAPFTPRLGVAALNPHGGESGLFGREEIDLIAPAVEAARSAGLDVHGPIPADTLFRHAAAGAYDGVVAMYHDQGHIALKLLGIHDAVNVTLGLPIVRTSVAHGTAFDIAWQGKAAPDSLLQAVEVAAGLARAKQLTAAND